MSDNDQNKGESLNESDSASVIKVPNTTNQEDETKVPNSTTNENQVPNTTNPKCDSQTDVEKFGGKIVYNPDGSAYIIEDGDLSEEEALPLPKQEGCIIEKTNENQEQNEEENPSYPLIANAIYVTRSAAYYNALYGQAYAKILRDKMAMPEAPIVHSYKVYSLRQECNSEAEPPLLEYSTVPVKPILMCFVCKLSFGFATSFVNHCTGEHNICLSDKEKSILDAKNSSALIQFVGKDKEPTLSFLEPVVKKVPNNTPTANAPAPSTSDNATKDQILSPNAIKGLLSAALTQQQKFPSPLDSAGPSSNRLPPFPPSNLPPFLANAMANSGSLLENLTSAAMLRNSLESLARKSPSDNNNGTGRSSVSPVTPTSMAPSPLSLPNLLGQEGIPGTTIGACPEHINGRPTGVECANCDMLLNRMPGGVAWNAARNSCKTLKCPKCNWHYKYQETLEIHMKEKHPENDATCIYCITGQQHPRLARGETYTCGYKPYRCEVCNYSTTTKGNLSIHTQSDKHLNNMQELQKGGVVTSPDGTKVTKGPFNPPFNPLASLVKQKPNWRCDVCNYETNVARNLRIHMTSEKHTHNIMVLQQNVKHMQQQMAGGGNGPHTVPPVFPGLPDPSQLLQMQLQGGNLNLPDKPGQSEAAMADMAYLQALMMQMMTGGQFPPGPLPNEFNIPGNNNQNDHGLNPESMEPPPEPAEPNPQYLFNCCVCKVFSCDNLESLSQHLTLDRSRSRSEDEVSVVIAGNSICKLCNYKTNLKANFQLHCKTDKHLQRLNHVNHIKEGGASNEWKLKFLNIANPVQLRCNACDYYTNSLHKLQIHVSSQRHEISNVLFNHLRRSEAELNSPAFTCVLCKFSANGKLALMSHVRSMKHLQMEQIHQIQKRAEGNQEQTEIGDIFKVVESTEAENAPNDSSGEKNENENNENSNESNSNPTPCPLCQEPYAEYSELENHVMQIHSVNSEGLQRLLVLMEGSHWLNNNRSSRNNDSDCENSANNTEDSTEIVTGGTISEKHVYKYRCAQCSLAFKTAEKLALHSQYHVIRDSTKCKLCSRSFRSVQALLKHVESSHNEVPAEELAHYKLGLMNHPLLMAGLSGQILDSSTTDLLKKESAKDDSNENEDEDLEASKKSPSHIFKASNKSEKSLNYPLEKYLDPNRPYKCDVCKESFTQKNILLVHYNSVSHLHKLKKTMQDQQNKTAETEPRKSPPRQTSLESALNNMANAKQMRLEDEASDKPYKCNICKVSYNQGSTLDIHIRSVLHQTRASKLQDLALAGQIDFSKPLIEQPDSKQLQEQHKKILQDMLSPKSSFNSSSSTNPSPTGSPTNSLINLQQILLNAKNQQQQQQNEQNNEQQQILQQFLQTLNNGNNENPPNEEQLKNFLAEHTKKNSSNQTVKNLLENYGFELVMQFNENLQRRKEEEERRKKQEMMDQENSKETTEPKETATPPMNNDNNSKEMEENEEQSNNESNKEDDESKPNNPPEIMKSKCPACSKEFSSIWVLKAHSEEVHKDVVPQDFLEKYIEELKSNLDKSEESESSPIKKSNQDLTPSTLLTPEKSSEDGDRTVNFPETSTPKSRSSTPAAGASTPAPEEKKEVNLADFSSNFQKAMLNAQQQSQGINPMLLQMAQFQGMNPLVAMNLHPPLIPPSLLAAQQSGSNQNGIAGPIMKPSPTSSNEDNAQQLQLMMKLGIDPKLLAQSGLDPKFLFNNGPKLPDPNLLALLSGVGNQQQQQQMPENIPDPKLLFQMMQMGMPGQGPDPQLLLKLMGKDPMSAGPLPGLPGFDSRQGPQGPMPGIGTKPVFPQPEQTKRARTRITDDQLKVLRSNFDINNSPSEEQIMSMAAQTGLPPKVIKHWFRNTLFKERQKNKDSPYNFNNPPSTMLNLEEYERTGEPKVIPLKPEEQQQYTNDHNAATKETEDRKDSADSPLDKSNAELRVKNNEDLIASSASPPISTSSITSTSSLPNAETSLASSLTLSSILSSQMAGQLPKPGGFLPHPLVPNFPPSTTNAMSGFLNPLANMMANEQPQRRSPTPQNQPPSGPGGHQQGKRANRTRFTDYQIKVLQEFFENNAYPKDDDLEYLSKLLSLSPRVIVVWFQNARQKARKIYENQPPLDPNDDGAGRFTRTPGLNYQCKKCLLVFQRYYELIRHQKQHCFKEEDAKRSAQAQKAAAQAAAQFSSQQLGSSPSTSSYQQQITSHHSDDSNSSTSHERAIQSPMFNHNFQDKRRSFDGSADEWGSEKSFNVQNSVNNEDKKMTPSMFDQLTRGDPAAAAAAAAAHQGLFPKLTAPSTLFPSYPPSSPFGILQQQALQQNNRDRDSDDFDTESVGSSPSSGTKRKHSEDGVDISDEKDESGQPRDKRLRTTILPEQLDYLYQKYQIESNPSRKMLEQIATEVGLRKRVVQVWFQNTRARERKGQFRAHQQVINKRCPCCPAIFRVRSALESHLATKHADHYTRGEIDIDALPDAEGFHDSSSANVDSSPVSTTPNMPPMPPLVPTTTDQLHSMQKYYEDTMKRYMNDLQSSTNANNTSTSANDPNPNPGLGDPNPPALVGQQS